MAEEKELTEEAKKQRRKREKAAAKAAALGVEKFTVEVAGVVKPSLKRVMAAHSINNQKDIHRRQLMNLIAADFETHAQVLRCVTTLYVVNEKMSRAFHDNSLADLLRDLGDEVIMHPSSLNQRLPLSDRHDTNTLAASKDLNSGIMSHL